MARFSAFLNSERGTEIHRLGHREIKSTTGSCQGRVRIECYAFDSKENKKDKDEYINVEVINGYGQYVHTPFVLFTIHNGKIELPDNLLERVQRWNDEIEGRNVD